MTTWRKVTEVSALRNAWNVVLRNDLADGVQSRATARFADALGENLERISDALRDGSYRPDGYASFQIPKGSGGVRAIDVPSVRDRVVERSLLALLTKRLDPLMGPCSYAYRPGISVIDAVQAVARMRDTGKRYVARTDIHDFFPSIPRERVRRLVHAAGLEEPAEALLLRLINRTLPPRAKSPRPDAGLPQGSPLSPVLANLVLAQLDIDIASHGFPVVRYADDLIIGATSEREAWEAMRVASDAAKRLDLKTGSAKSEVNSFDEGFTYLGEDFGPRYPPVLTSARMQVPDRKIVYVGLQGSLVFLKGGRLKVRTRHDQVILDVPSSEVRRIVVLGSVGVTSGVRAWALGRGVEIIHLSRRGSYLGHTVNLGAGLRVERIRAQLEFSDDTARRIGLARRMVESKVRQQRAVLVTLLRREAADECRRALSVMELAERNVAQAETIDVVLGLEGSAAAAYFSAIGQLVPEDMRFTVRSRRPPKDVLNSALSYGYALLEAECVGALAAVGLEPNIGVLHTSRGKRPALALDLMEDFRPLVVDQVVLDLARRRQLRPEFGQPDAGTGGVYLTRAGKSALIDGYERRMLHRARNCVPDHSGTLRSALRRQAELLAATIGGSEEAYAGTSWRP